jgi:GT2 family glycosyltransferase
MRVATGRYFFLLNSDAWVVGEGLERLVAYADAHPEAAVVGPRLSNTDGTLQRSVRGEPTVWRLATEYLFIRKLAPRTRLLNP